ncbi:hypothetical protein CYLTODRAFT_400363 [Cylindrobasidium torrendii FP15055 ss-10]|uniref:CSN8/PSMD8/EIF3K domain-containing protein n=1 Tax=Cylindrobasidium torrendii FP15055 ss-10 TaxID=1314674 RepID=A0A0D7B5K3_9AGAR|nr:hypothetical protein CYLTODRAFT_400363 [Cylindrobasidium torrendii FP15055 ss-10]
MVNGPPTPPPTTDVEIQDATKEAEAESNAATASTPAPAPAAEPDAEPAPPQQPAPVEVQAATHIDAYQQAFTMSLASQIQAKQWDSLIRHAEYADLVGYDLPTRIFVIAPLILAYLIKDQVPAAKFALNRISTKLSRSPLAQSLLKLTAAVSDRNYREIYSRLSQVPLNGDVNGQVSAQFAEGMSTLVAAFGETFQMRTFILLSTAYSEISLSLAQSYLGMSQELLLKAAEEYGWKFDANNQILSPSAAALKGPSPEPATLGSFDFISNSVAQLEL